jgi:hypothetical protein
MKVHKRLAVVLIVPAFALSGCYIIPVGADGGPAWPPGAVWGPGTHTAPSVPASHPSAPPVPRASVTPVSAPASSATLQARLYPANDIATQTGMVSGTVTNMMSGKGRFLLDYKGELLTGEATRVSGDERKGVASAYSQAGAYMSCEYQMSSPYQGAGTCTFSNGARYQVHIGN